MKIHFMNETLIFIVSIVNEHMLILKADNYIE